LGVSDQCGDDVSCTLVRNGEFIENVGQETSRQKPCGNIPVHEKIILKWAQKVYVRRWRLGRTNSKESLVVVFFMKTAMNFWVG
jgi:hypothetical protein